MAWRRITRWAHSVSPRRADARADALAGLTGAISSVPDGMATAVLAGVNPVYGLYASATGPLVGGLGQRTQLMLVAPTSAAALAAASTLHDTAPKDRADALFLMTIVAGIVMVVAGVLRLGRYVRFVTQSVMIGFLTGIACNIVFGQLGDLTGTTPHGRVALNKAIDVVTHPGRIRFASLATGAAALAIMALLARTRLSSIAALLALVIPTVVVSALGAGGVARVSDQGPLPRGIPLPHVPALGLLSVNLIVGAAAVTLIVLVQGAGVSEAAPNPDGSVPDANGDFVAQGIANLAAGVFRGMPVGGSVGQTSLNVAAGARSRWSAIFGGAWMFAILAAFSGLVGKVAMPTLAAVLIFAAVGAIRLAEGTTIWRTGATSRVALVTTFTATLLLPVAAAVGIGVAIALLLQLNREALDLKVVELVPRHDGTIEERDAPHALRDHDVVVLDVYGSLFYAGARTLQARLPDPADAVEPVVVLRLRGRTTLGATFFLIVADYAHRIGAVGGRLYLSGIDPKLVAQLRRTRRVTVTGPVEVMPATPVVGESTRAAYEAGKAWLVSHAGATPDASA